MIYELIFKKTIKSLASSLNISESSGDGKSPLPYQKRDQLFTAWKKEALKRGLLSFLRVLKNYITIKEPSYLSHFHVKKLPEHPVFLE